MWSQCHKVLSTMLFGLEIGLYGTDPTDIVLEFTIWSISYLVTNL